MPALNGVVPFSIFARPSRDRRYLPTPISGLSVFSKIDAGLPQKLPGRTSISRLWCPSGKHPIGSICDMAAQHAV